ncbi:DUF551 domain-containing protein [Alteraurantiacibacter buctensis]|nr:DUF551 domain-containing protein [Alteraurantiacibacter buctensis]
MERNETTEAVEAVAVTQEDREATKRHQHRFLTEGRSETELLWEAFARHRIASVAAARPVLFEDQWQPIETAPRDGTWVQLTGGQFDYGWDGETQPPVVSAQFNYNCWQAAWYDSGYYGEYENPTHWQPLPTPPAIRTAGGSHEG